ncbi:MAG TPA: adenylate/guanylate cyclase domain-containing protein, partial [Acidimicrobiales bacterium]|nr:adenylate/guanylate cyclase domain-containing protein [Acidimicrobiales bacterium]
MDCPACGTPAPVGARFCATCGASLVDAGDERRVVTVLFADLVGFTMLAESRDPEEVKLLVDRCFELLVHDITAFGGRVDKIVGDAIVALFGAPVAHEDDPERAVRAALRMQETLTAHATGLGPEVRMRIGVNTGEVLVGSLRADGDYTAMGDVVNIASRLQAHAQPGQIIVGPATHAATEGAIAYQPEGLLAVRGRGEPIEVWSATASLLPPGTRRRRSRTPLVGRTAEIGLVGHALDAALGHRRSLLVVLLGEAGVGKSRFATEVAGIAAERHGALVLEGRGVPYGEANVWWPIAEAVRRACGLGPDDGPGEVRDRVQATVAGALGVALHDGEAGRITAGLLHVLGLEGPLRGIDRQRAREEVHRSVLGFLGALLSTRPVVLTISDVHWADRLVLELLSTLLERLPRAPFVLVTTARPPFSTAWAPAEGRYDVVRLTLDPLDRESTRHLLDGLLPDRLDPELREALLDRSGGNPFFLEELVALVAAGELEVSDGPSSSPGALGRLPDTLRGLVAARLDGLDSDERRTLEDAAVLGRGGPVEGLIRMAAADRAGKGVRSTEQVLVALDGLVATEILVVDQGMYEFRSDLVRDVAYGTLTKTDRAKRHFGIGEFMETFAASGPEVDDTVVDFIAHHYGQAATVVRELGSVDGVADDVVERGLRWVGEAARRAEAGDVHVVAERLFSQALALLDEGATSERVSLLLGRAEARAEQHRLGPARADVEAALGAAEQLDDPRCRAQALLIRGSVEQREGATDTAVATLAEAEAAFTALGERRGTAEALRLRGMAEMFGGDGAAARRSVGAALDAFVEIDDRHGQAWALQNLAWLAFNEGRVLDADHRLEQSAELFREIGDSGGLGWALGLQAWIRFYQGRLDEAERLGDLILAEARGRGDRWAEGMMLVLAASVRLWSGRADSAVGRAEEALDVFRAIGDPEREAQAAATLGRALIAVGSVGEGFRTIDLAIDTGRRGDTEALAVAATAAASAAIAVGDPERALRTIALVGAERELDPAILGDSERLVALGMALLMLGEVDEATAHLEHALDVDEGEPSGYAHSAVALARAVAGDADGAERLVDDIEQSSRASYLDRLTGWSVLASVRA